MATLLVGGQNLYDKLRGWLHGEYQSRLNFSPMGRAEILLRLHDKFQLGQKSCVLENNLTAHARVAFSARADIPFRLHGLFADFSARLPGVKIPARFQKPGYHFHPGLKPSACNRHFHFKRISFRTRAPGQPS